MLQIRHSVFETNSSSVHSMIVCSADDYDAWVAGDVLLNIYHDDEYMWMHWDSDCGVYIETTKGIPPMFVTPEDAAYYDSEYPYPPAQERNWGGGLELDYVDTDGNWHSRKFITFEEYTESFLWDFESFSQKYTSESGDNIVIMGYYGRD